jgi:hypothetical protein
MSTMTAPTTDLSTEDTSFDALVRRLNEQSVRKHFDAYEDVAWDEHPIDPTDPRWELGGFDPLGRTAWYQALPQPERARLGLHLVVAKMQVGYFFENVLKRGLLEHAHRLPAGSPELRYAYHEVIEEAQHSLMFQEFVARAGYPEVAPVPWDARFGAAVVVKLGRWFPELFFVFVLGGEDPVDHLQRQALREAKEGRGLHPLLERIMRIHVTEEARHLSFARHWLKARVPDLDPVRRGLLSIAAPLILGEMGAMMLAPSREVVRTFEIPDDVMREAYHDNPEWQATAATALRKVRQLSSELGLLNPVAKRIWKARRIWGD